MTKEDWSDIIKAILFFLIGLAVVFFAPGPGFYDEPKAKRKTSFKTD